MASRNIKQVIVIRKDLKMRRGKEIAQGSHASMAFMTRRLQNPSNAIDTVNLSSDERKWIDEGFTKVCLQVSSEKELLAVHEAARDAGLTSHLITDSGKTEFGGIPTHTCCAIGPNRSEEIDKITGHLALY